MVMSDSEILKMYQQSKDPKKQVRILAELNGVPLCIMEKKLKGFGVYQGSDQEPLFDAGEAFRLFEEGLSDKEIAARLHIRLQTFCEWRRQQGLVRPHKRKRSFAPTPPEIPENGQNLCDQLEGSENGRGPVQIPSGLLAKALSMFPDTVQPVLDLCITSGNMRSLHVFMEVFDGKVVNGIIKIR